MEWKLNCSIRSINRYINKYNEHGKQSFSHGNKKKKPAHSFDADLKGKIIQLYHSKYFDANFKHFQELLQRNEDIIISYSALYSLLMNDDVISPKARRLTKRMYKKKLKDANKQVKNAPQSDILEDSIIPLEFAHPRQERCKYFGESVQLDASQHLWFGKDKTHLHLAIDNATSQILGAWFDTQETLTGYYRITKQMIESYGIPAQLLTDNRTVFNYERKSSRDHENSSTTQYGYACKLLGIDLKTTSVPQAKGHVERSFGTHQSRLIVELRLAGCNSIEDANEFLSQYVKRHNKMFALPFHSISSVFEKLPESMNINHILAVRSTRVIDNGHCIKFKNKHYATYNNDFLETLRPKTKVMVVKTLDGELFAISQNQTYHLNEILLRKTYSEEFDNAPKVVKSKVHKPIDNHPWNYDHYYHYLKTELPNFNDFIYSEANAYHL